MMTQKDKTIGRLLANATAFLRQKNIPNPRLDAEVLLGHCLDCSRVHLYASSHKMCIRDSLNGSPEAIISFGQGCEGEPALSPIVPSAVRMIRQATKEGTLNMNTNAGFTKGIVAACDAGLDSLRVSLISAREEAYNAYYRPKDYSLHQVKQSIAYARAQGIFVSINLLLFPGFTDREEEMDALLAMLFQYNINMVQMRNLNTVSYTHLDVYKRQG